jgi:hypothetical protein
MRKTLCFLNFYICCLYYFIFYEFELLIPSAKLSGHCLNREVDNREETSEKEGPWDILGPQINFSSHRTAQGTVRVNDPKESTASSLETR